MTGVTIDGRIVWGHPSKAQQQRDPVTKQPKFKPDGSPIMVHSFGLAVEKQKFTQMVWPAMHAEAMTGYPQGVPQRFSWKYVDGDGIDGEGKSYATREGYAGHYIISVSSQTGFPPQVVKFENNAYRQLEPTEIKCGDYVAVGLDFKVNVPTERTHTPSLYVNPQSILLIGYGQEIINRPDASQIFGAAPPQFALPPGASLTPQMPQGALPPGMPAGAPPTAPGYPPQPGPAPQPGYPPQAPAPQYGAPPQPGYPPQAPQAPYQPPAPPPAPGYPPQPGMMPPPAPGFAAGAPMAPPPGSQPYQPGPAPQYAPPPQPGYPPAPGYPPMPGQPAPR